MKRARATFYAALMCGVLLAEPVDKLKARKVCQNALKDCEKHSLYLPPALKERAKNAERLK
eukprot:196917-Amphidinium_carterae.1